MIKDKVFLVGVHCKSEHRKTYDETMIELFNLAQTSEVEVEDTFVQTLLKPNIATYIGKGKIQEIGSDAKSREVKTLIFNDDLSPAQARNISDLTGCNVVDRTELILDIFARHARTKQAKQQVELAQLEYSYTRLKRLWKHLSRIQGGIGFRGPGEKQIEVDRRAIKKRTSILKKRLEEINNTSLIKRKKRQMFTSISLVGYTNAGKSTLFNRLTHENRYTADKLFATLDSKTRLMSLDSGEKFVLTDTIGFINKLPHKLISSFHSTLLDVVEADLLLHVVDISHPDIFKYIYSVENVLREIQADDKNILFIFNKCDKIDKLHFSFLKKQLLQKYPDSVFISALKDENFEELISKFEEFTRKSKIITTLHIPLNLQKLVSFIYKNTEVLEIKYDENHNENIMKIKINRQLYPNIKKQIEIYKIKEYIHK